MLNRKLIRSNSFLWLALNQSIFPRASRSNINRLWSFVAWASPPPHPPTKTLTNNAGHLSDKSGLSGYYLAEVHEETNLFKIC